MKTCSGENVWWFCRSSVVDHAMQYSCCAWSKSALHLGCYNIWYYGCILNKSCACCLHPILEMVEMLVMEMYVLYIPLLFLKVRTHTRTIHWRYPPSCQYAPFFSQKSQDVLNRCQLALLLKDADLSIAGTLHLNKGTGCEVQYFSYKYITL